MSTKKKVVWKETKKGRIEYGQFAIVDTNTIEGPVKTLYHKGNVVGTGLTLKSAKERVKDIEKKDAEQSKE